MEDELVREINVSEFLSAQYFCHQAMGPTSSKSKASTLRTAAKTAKTPEVVEEVDESPVPLPASKPAIRRGRKPAAPKESPDVQPQDDEIQAPVAPAKTPARRSRKPAVETDTNTAEASIKPTPARRGRPPKAQTPAESESEASVPVRKGRSAKAKGTTTDDEATTTIGRRGTRAKPLEVEPDSVDGAESSEEVATAPAKGRRLTRGRKATVDVIKEEPSDVPMDTSDPEGNDAPAPTRGGRGRNTRAKGATVKKGATSGPSDAIDKENTPESTGSVEEEEVVEMPVKGRATRTKKAAATKVKAEVFTEPEAPARSTRAARARVKTT